MGFKPVGLSGADRFGILYTDGRKYLRGIDSGEVENVKAMFADSFIDELQKRNMIPAVWVLTENVPAELARYRMVLGHEAVEPVSYPREWSFAMFRVAMLAYLDIAELADSFGYRLKDCHLFNFVFRGGHPLWVDLGSFVKKDGSESPFPLNVFKYSILAPMLMWNRGAAFAGQRLLSSPVDALTEQEYLACMPELFKHWHRFLKIGRKAKRIFGHADDWGKQIKVLRGTATRLRFTKSTMWDAYHNEFIGPDGMLIMDGRFRRIIDLLKQYGPKTILELAGNAGVLSELILNEISGVKIICTDYDGLAIDSLFYRIAGTKMDDLAFAKLDFMVSEYSSAETPPAQRFKSEAVLALAVTHHLLLTQGYSYEQVFEAIKEYSTKFVFIEFMPLGLWNGKSAPPVPDWYSLEAFKDSFEKYFEVLAVEKLEVNRILLVGKVK